MRPPVPRGRVVLTRFPFTDLAGSAVRPALVVSVGSIGDDVVLAAISSVVRQPLAATDCLIESAHPEFALTGLRVTSVVRLHKLATVDRTVLIRSLGHLGAEHRAEADRLLKVVLGF
jgi:mRNA interferase MazF